MIQHKNLYVYGDSYATPDFCVAVKDSFWGLLADDLNVMNTYNSAQPGSSFDVIQHRIIGDIDSMSPDSLLLIGIPILERFSTVRNHVDNVTYKDNTCFAKPGKHYDENLTYIGQTPEGVEHDILSLSFFDHKSADYILHSDRMWLEVCAIRSVLILDQYIQSKGLACMFINLDQPYELNDYEFSKDLIRKVSAMPNQILFNNTLQSINDGVFEPVDFDKFGYYGHHGPEGNKNYYENSLKPQMIKAGLM